METEISEGGPTREVPRRCPVIFMRMKILREKKDAPRVAGGLMPLRPAWVMGEINLTILGGEPQSGLGNRCREPEDLKAGKACMHAGQEEDLQVLRAATVRQRPKPPAHAPVCRSSHTRPIHTHTPAPPGAHATQLQTGLSKERGLAGTRAQRNPQSGNRQAAVPRPSLPPLACELTSGLPLGARVPFPPSGLSRFARACQAPRLTSSEVAVQPATETGPVEKGRRSGSLGFCG